MEPVTLVVGTLAVVFALLAVLQLRRVTDLEEQVRALEAELKPLRAQRATEKKRPKKEKPAMAPVANAEPVEKAEEPAKAEPAKAEETEAKAEPVPSPAPAREPSPPPEPPKRPQSDPLRLEALKLVTDALELARYSDFDAIVESPSTYRVTVPITAKNGMALRYLTPGMFACLKDVKIEDNLAVLHIDTAKGPP